jgi:hypothetical protein
VVEIGDESRYFSANGASAAAGLAPSDKPRATQNTSDRSRTLRMIDSPQLRDREKGASPINIDN